jgi:hypothetical protein
MPVLAVQFLIGQFADYQLTVSRHNTHLILKLDFKTKAKQCKLFITRLKHKI